MVQFRQAKIIMPFFPKAGSREKLSNIPVRIRLRWGLGNERTFSLMGNGGTEGCRVGNVTSHRLDKPSGTNYKDKVSTRQILYTNLLHCTQEVEQYSQSLIYKWEKQCCVEAFSLLFHCFLFRLCRAISPFYLPVSCPLCLMFPLAELKDCCCSSFHFWQQHPLAKTAVFAHTSVVMNHLF